MNASLQEAFNKDVHGKVLKADLQLKEAVQKMASSKAVVENVANSLASALTPAIHASFKDALTATLVPAFEKSSQNMFVQLSSTFNKGLKEYESQLKTHVNKQLDPVVKDLKDKRAINEMEKKLVSTIKTELRAVNNRSAASPNVASSSPSGPEVQAQIKTKLHEGKVNDAFRLALAAQNLAILVTTCEMVNPDQILNQIPCPLSQEVLLCLIQQLAHNLESNTDLKLRYLEQAIPNLEPSKDPNVMTTLQQTIPTTMSTVHQQLTIFAQANPNKKIKMLLMAIQTLKS